MAQNQGDSANKPSNELIFKPALRQIGVTDCPVCKTRVAVFLAKTQRPFLNCSYCSARIFYNGHESIRLLQKKMKPIPADLWDPDPENGPSER
jgi:DNA-directed RNA polymerase subunit RPC12/RpoP